MTAVLFIACAVVAVVIYRVIRPALVALGVV